jgi:hypothetical protein
LNPLLCLVRSGTVISSEMLLTVEAFVREKARREIDPAVSQEVRPALRKVREEICPPTEKKGNFAYSYLPSPRLGKHSPDLGRRGEGRRSGQKPET